VEGVIELSRGMIVSTTLKKTMLMRVFLYCFMSGSIPDVEDPPYLGPRARGSGYKGNYPKLRLTEQGMWIRDMG
jgi:hypothetical protein